MLICQYCPILCDYPAEQHAEAFERFLEYKTRVPVRGAIMLNDAMDAVVLVKGWKKNANWSFPRGKINKEEPDLTCAVREVYEETGYDLEAAGLVGDGENVKSIEVAMREQSLKLFVFRGVPMDTHFEPRTRKEISKIQWYKLSELPTFKRNKQQQEEKGDALANNANKFYMVAPFLGHLKKWIAQQRKLDKSNSSHRAASYHQAEISAATDVEDHHIEEGLGTRGEIDRLLDAHRRRKQKVSQHLPQQGPSNLPEVSPAISQTGKVPPKMHIDTAQNPDQLNKVDLLAILKGGKASNQEPPPRTPAAQMIEEPVMPHSPPHHHLSRMPTLPLAPTLASMQGQTGDTEKLLPNMPQVGAVPPTAEPAKILPQAHHINNHNAHTTEKKQYPVSAPYQRKGNLEFANMPPHVGSHGPSIPPASNLPQPILTQQKATLLELFKKGKASETPRTLGVTPKAEDTTRKSSIAFVPSQVLSRSSTEKASPLQPVSGQKADLLAMFKAPSTSKSAQTQNRESSLKLPPGPVELSAFPSPRHSREPSQTEPEYKEASADGYITIQKQPSVFVSKQHPPTSATISGPLNIPQFDMIAKHNREAKDARQKNGANPDKKHPVTILPRPEKSHAPATATSTSPTPAPVAPTRNNASQPTESSRRKQKPAQPKQLLTPVKTAQPPTPNLEARSTPPKPFHPQILKRPAHLLSDHDIMSPIQPLPSPKHAIPNPKVPQKAQPASADHKKSLLSLFSAPSPAISPPSTTIRMEDSLASLVSPLSENRGPQSALERPPPWKETKQGSIAEQRQNLATGATVNKETPGQLSGPLPTLFHNEKKKQSADEARPAFGNGQEPERRQSAKETPDELKNLLLGRLANIKV